MAVDIDNQIRTKIKPIIQPAYPTAVIWPYNALSHKLADWPGLFRTSDGKTHGWIIKRADADSEWKTAGRDRRFFDYDLMGFYGYRSGMEGNNSDDEFSIILETAYDNLKAVPRLNFDTVVERHELLQFRQITTLDTGEETLHFAHGRLRVQLCC